MKKLILIMLSLLFYGLLFSQEATINSCNGDGGADCPLTVCESFTLDLTAGVTGGSGSVDWRERYSDDGGTSFSGWTIVDQSALLNTISVPNSGFAQSGRIYEYWLRVTVGVDEYWTFSRVYVNSNPSVILLSSHTEICTGETVVFSASAGNVNYDFQVNGFSEQMGSVDTFAISTLSDSDIVTVVVTDVNGCEATSAGITMTVHTLPTIDNLVYSTAYSSATEECVGTMVDVTITMTGTSPFTVKVYDVVGGNPNALFFTETGLTGPTDSFTKPVYGVGANEQYYMIEDAFCPSVVITP